jgi:hypothetical protein
MHRLRGDVACRPVAKAAQIELRRRTEGGEGRWAVRPSSRRWAGRVLRNWSEGGPKVEKAPGRRTNVGRKAEATDQFRPPRCGLCVMKLCARGLSSGSNSCETLPDGVSPNTEGGQTADGRWNRPTNFGHLIGDLLDMSTAPTRPWWQSSVPIGGELWPPLHPGAAAIEELCS